MTRTEYIKSLHKKDYEQEIAELKEQIKNLSNSQNSEKTYTIDDVPEEYKAEIQEKIDKGEIEHNPWPEAQFKAIMANTSDPEKRAEYAKHQKEGKE